MADYWKSNPRKFCEACKCWFADDKPSRDFHEGGRRHQANVKKQLEVARNRSSENSREKANLEKTLRSIEHAAFNSYQQDMAGVTKKAKPRGGSEQQMSQIEQFLAAEQDTLEREIEKEKIRTMAQEKMQEIQTKAAMEAAQKAYFDALADGWQQCYSPEGYLYYYNAKTGVSQWEVPSNSAAASDQDAIKTSTGLPSSTAEPSSTTASTENVKRTAEKAGMQEPSEHTQPKRKARAYGSAWTTVTVYDQDKAEPHENSDKQGDDSEEQSTKEEEIQFEEKTLSGGILRSDHGKFGGDFKGFSFKKRTNKRVAKIRGRTND